jgi:hypothetical protein
MKNKTKTERAKPKTLEINLAQQRKTRKLNVMSIWQLIFFRQICIKTDKLN